MENFIFRAAESILGTAVDEIGRKSQPAQLDPNLIVVKLTGQNVYCNMNKLVYTNSDTFCSRTSGNCIGTAVPCLSG